MANSVDPDQTAPIQAVCSWSTMFASRLYSSVMLGNYLQQTSSADDIFKSIFSCCKQCGPRSYCSYMIGAVCSGSTLFASILYLSVMLANYLQQTTSADDIFKRIFFMTL